MAAYFDPIKVMFNHYFQFGSFDTIYPRHSPKNVSLKAMALRTQIPSLEDVTLIISNLEPKKSSLIYLRRETRV